MKIKSDQGEIAHNLILLADWLSIKHPKFKCRLLVVGGAALALKGHRDQTFDVDVLSPSPLPKEIEEGVRAVAMAQGLSIEWLNDHVANVLRSLFKVSHAPPPQFGEESEILEVAENLTIALASKQTMVTLKLLAASPGVKKHTLDLAALAPSLREIQEAVAVCLSLDDTNIRRVDLRMILEELEIDADEVLGTD
ncbi:MAG: hypothetical protein JRF33_01805 [Deltaproteobacteria bacterium]|nr:hypothetical protein [Deltaproteobacteria bacterium]